MNVIGIKKAKYVLLNIRDLNNRIIERDKARVEFEAHLEKLREKPTKTGIDKVKLLANNFALKERKLGFKCVNKNKEIESLKKKISNLKKE